MRRCRVWPARQGRPWWGRSVFLLPEGETEVQDREQGEDERLDDADRTCRKPSRATFGSQSSQAGIRPMIASMMPPAKMLPKSRRASVNGLTISSRTVSGISAGYGEA